MWQMCREFFRFDQGLAGMAVDHCVGRVVYEILKSHSNQDTDLTFRAWKELVTPGNG